jgi:hypothetical protein
VRGYDVPDNDEEGGQVFGWSVGAQPQSFTVQGVDLTGMSKAVLNVSMWPHEDDPVLEYRLNGGAWHTFTGPDAPGGFSLHSYAIPIEIAPAGGNDMQLHDGDNTIELRAPGEPLPVGNLDITVMP